jgi:recombination protein RecT
MSTSQALKAVATGQPKKAEKPTTIQGFLDTYKGEIQRALPRHMTADRMARIALTEFRKNPALLKCEPASLFGAVIQCAQLGLEPGGALGHAYLIPFENRKKGITEVQFIVGYRGMIDLARRSGQIVSLEAHAVYEGDQFECEFGLESTLKHVPDWQNENRTKDDKLKFVYAVAKLKDGGTQFEVMSRAEIIAIRARSRAASSGPWVTDFPAMALKTVIRRLFKYLPVSVEMQQAVGLDEQVEAGLSQDNGAVIDSSFSVVDDEPQGDVTLDTSPVPEGPVTAQMNGLTFAQVADKLEKADGLDVLDVAFDLVSAVADEQQRGELKAIYERRKAELSGQ